MLSETAESPKGQGSAVRARPLDDRRDPADLYDPAVLAAEAAAADDLPAVHELGARLAAVPGVRSARLGAVDPDRPEDPGALVYRIGPAEWGLELRVSFTEPRAYARLGPVVAALAAAAGRAIARSCQILPAAPGPLPPPLYQAISGHDPEIIVIVDPAAGWHIVSEAFDAVLGYDRHAVPPGGLLELVHPADRAAALDTFVTACAGGPSPHPLDLRVRTSGQQWRILEVITRPLVTEPGVHVVAYFATDVTAQRHTERAVRLARERLARLAGSLPDGVVLLDEAGRIELINDTGRRMLAAAVPGSGPDGRWRTWSGLLAAIEGELVAGPRTVARFAELVAGEPAVTGAKLAFIDGRVLEVDVLPVSCADRRAGAVVYLRNATARIGVPGRLPATRRQPAERTVDAAPGSGLSDLILAEAETLSSEFVATVAQELREPLASVVAFVGLLGDPTSGSLSRQQRGYLEVIDRGATRLLRLIEELLLLSRLEAGTLPVERVAVRLRDLLAAAVLEREPAATAAGIELVGDLSEGPLVLADEARLRQAIGNVLDNALRFTPRGGRITVVARPGANSWTIEIADTGIGIPATDLPRLFSAFSRGSNVTSAVGRSPLPGAGLGLVVSRAIMELHQGEISLASTEGIGTTVTLRLPAGPRAAGGTGTDIGG